MTLLAQVKSLVGDSVVAVSVAQWLMHGARILVDFVPLERVEEFLTDFTSGSDEPLDIRTMKWKNPLVNGRPANLYSGRNMTWLTDENSLLAPTAFSPVAVVTDGFLEGFPKPESGEPEVSVRALVYPTFTANSIGEEGGSDESDRMFIDGFPDSFLSGIVIYAAIQALNKRMSDTAETAPTFTFANVADETISFDGLINLSEEFSTSHAYIEDEEDIELAEIKIKEIQTRLNEWAEETKLQLEHRVSQAQIDKDINALNATTTLQAEIETFKNKVQRSQVMVAQIADLIRQWNELLQLYAGVPTQKGKSE